MVRTSPPRCAAPSLAALLLVACASTERVRPVALELEPAAHLGTSLSGPVPERDPAQVEWDRALTLELALEYHRRAPEGGLPLAGRAVILDGADTVFGARTRLARGARRLPADPLPLEVARGAPPTYRVAWGTSERRALAPGTTVSWALLARPEFLGGSQAVWERGALAVSRPRSSAGEHARSAEVTLTLEGLVVPEQDPDDDEEDARVPAPDPVLRRERVVLADRLSDDGTPLRFTLPAPARQAPHGHYVVELRLVPDEPGAPDAGDSLVAGTRALLEGAHDEARARTAWHGVGEPSFRLESEQALRALERHELRRPALVFLAQSTGAALVEELALVAEPEALEELLAAIAERSHRLGTLPEGPAEFSGFLELTAWRWLGARTRDETRTLEPELAGLLARHAGALAEDPELLLEALAVVGDVESLAARLVEENRLFLGDAHPAARVRAFDWLAARGTAPEGYDPLGPAEERRAALRRAERAASEAADEPRGAAEGER